MWNSLVNIFIAVELEEKKKKKYIVVICIIYLPFLANKEEHTKKICWK